MEMESFTEESLVDECDRATVVDSLRHQEAADSDVQESLRSVSYQPMLLVAIAAILGVVLARLAGPSVVLCWVLAAMGLFVWKAMAWLPRLNFRRADVTVWRSTLLLFAIAAAAGAWHQGYWHWFGQNEIGRFVSEAALPCCVEAIIESEPRFVASGPDEFAQSDETCQTRFAIRLLRLRDGVRWRKCTGRSELIVHEMASELRSGDRVRVFGKLVGVSAPTNPGQFDFGEFYRGKRTLAFVHAYRASGVEVFQPSDWSSQRWISGLRKRLNEIVWQYVGQQQAPFASAILLGNREQLTRQRRDRFVESGTVHLLAISGLHVGILAGAFLLLLHLPFFKRHVCLLLTIGFVIFYAWLVEFRPPATRASILIVLFCISRLLGERAFSMNLLAIAALIVLVVNPTDVFAIGPQLSFLAVATLIVGKEWIFWPPPEDPIDRLIASTRSRPVQTLCWMGRQLRTAVLVSGIIWVLALPIVAYQFHLVSFSALVVNPFLLLPVALALYGGLGLLVAGGTMNWNPLVAGVFGWFCERNLSFVEWAVAAAHAAPMGHYWTVGPSVWAVGLFYVGAFFLAAFPPTRLSGKWLGVAFVAWCLFAWWAPNEWSRWHRHERPLSCTFLDVGHGTSVLIQQPNGENWLYDAGTLAGAEYGARNIASALWYHGICELDAIVISHADSDHYNAIPLLLEKFSVKRVFVSQPMMRDHRPSTQRLLATIRESGSQISSLICGDAISTGTQAAVTVLSPGAEGFGENDNADSLVLLLESEGRRVLLPGDLERGGLESMLAQAQLDCDVVMAAHHGSSNSDPRRFMRWSTPELVCVSGGDHRVSDDVVELFRHSGGRRLVGRTDLHGAVRVELSREGVETFHWHRDRWRALQNEE